jgi:hypothetical protein
MNIESEAIPQILAILLIFEFHFLASPHWRLSPSGVNVLNGHSKPKAFRKEGWEAKSTYLIQSSSWQIPYMLCSSIWRRKFICDLLYEPNKFGSPRSSSHRKTIIGNE